MPKMVKPERKISLSLAELNESYGKHEPDGFFELLEIMQRVQEGSMSCRFGAKKFLAENK